MSGDFSEKEIHAEAPENYFISLSVFPMCKVAKVLVVILDSSWVVNKGRTFS